MSAYVVFSSTVLDESKLEAYAANALPIVAAYGGQRLAAGGLTFLHGDGDFGRGTVFEFPDRDSALAWHGSPTYQALATLRAEAMDCSIVLIA